jgi:hypothetical protein
VLLPSTFDIPYSKFDIGVARKMSEKDVLNRLLTFGFKPDGLKHPKPVVIIVGKKVSVGKKVPFIPDTF